MEALLRIKTVLKEGMTYPQEVYFSAPYKLTNFFRLPDGGIEYIVMNSSAGIMAGDRYSVDLEIKENSRLSLLSQSYEKIHKMDEGFAGRETEIKIGNNAYLKYFPLPVIPFAGSAFESKTCINLENSSSKLIYADILSSGRYHNQESFEYRSFKALTEIRIAGSLVFRENGCYLPGESQMDSIGFYEGYNVLGNLIVYGFSLEPEKRGMLGAMISEDRLDAGITELPGNGLFIRAFANESDELNSYFKKLVSAIENC